MSALLSPMAAWARAHGVAVAVEPYAHAAGRIAASAAGRRAASRALAELGGPALSIDDRRADGRAAWPPGFTGSISHADGLAVVAAARRADMLLGLDLERCGALPLDDATAVLDDAELAWAASRPQPDADATALWSAKEAAFKAWNEAADGALPPVDPRRHLHVTLSFEGEHGTVRVAPLQELAGAATAINGRIWRADGRIAVIVAATVVSRSG